MEQDNNIDNLIKTPKTVETEAGRVEFISPSDAIKLDEYKRKRSKGSASRISWVNTRPASHTDYNNR